MASMYSVAKGDLFIQSKHADESFEFEDTGGWILVFYNTPKKGKALVVDYTPVDYPAVTVSVTANWKARKIAQSVAKEDESKSVTF